MLIDGKEIDLLTCLVADLRWAIRNRQPGQSGDVESAISKRIALIERSPITSTRDGRWWHFANATAWPFGH